MSWTLPRNRMLRHTLTLLCAMGLAGAATWASHRWIERRNAPRRLEGSVGTVYLHSLLNIPVIHPGFEPFDLEERPHFAAFCRRVAQRAKLYMLDSSAEYDVALVGMFSGRGFPFISIDWNAEVDVCGNGKCNLFLAGQDGNSPVLYGGLIGNWLFYLVISAALLYAAEKAIIAVIIRRQRRRHGFPVVLINEEKT